MAVDGFIVLLLSKEEVSVTESFFIGADKKRKRIENMIYVPGTCSLDIYHASTRKRIGTKERAVSPWGRKEREWQQPSFYC